MITLAKEAGLASSPYSGSLQVMAGCTEKLVRTGGAGHSLAWALPALHSTGHLYPGLLVQFLQPSGAHRPSNEYRAENVAETDQAAGLGGNLAWGLSVPNKTSPQPSSIYRDPRANPAPAGMQLNCSAPRQACTHATSSSTDTQPHPTQPQAVLRAPSAGACVGIAALSPWPLSAGGCVSTAVLSSRSLWQGDV